MFLSSITLRMVGPWALPAGNESGLWLVSAHSAKQRSGRGFTPRRHMSLECFNHGWLELRWGCTENALRRSYQENTHSQRAGTTCDHCRLKSENRILVWGIIYSPVRPQTELTCVSRKDTGKEQRVGGVWETLSPPLQIVEGICINLMSLSHLRTRVERRVTEEIKQLRTGAQLCLFSVSLGRETEWEKRQGGEEHLGLLESEEVRSCCPDLRCARKLTTA